ncbi:MAG: hypothetical protein HWE12_07345 [Oceanospirillaceae bacterium]|nr:hypothetical protein [Oceanospirillaceae bacterium]
MKTVNLTPRTYGLVLVDGTAMLETFWLGNLECREAFTRIEVYSDVVDLLNAGGVVHSFGKDVEPYICEFAEQNLIDLDHKQYGLPF